MIESKTVFIIGACASYEAGLHVGKDLKDAIARKLDFSFDISSNKVISGDNLIIDALVEYAYQERNVNEYVGECRQIAAAMPLSISIDNYLDAHQGNAKLELCAKIAITQAILQAEAKSKLR